MDTRELMNYLRAKKVEKVQEGIANEKAMSTDYVSPKAEIVQDNKAIEAADVPSRMEWDGTDHAVPEK